MIVIPTTEDDVATLLQVRQAVSSHIARAGTRNVTPGLLRLEAELMSPWKVAEGSLPSPTPPDTVMLLDMKEVAYRLSASLTTVKKMVADGTLPSVKVSRRRYVRTRDLETYVEGLTDE